MLDWRKVLMLDWRKVLMMLLGGALLGTVVGRFELPWFWLPIGTVGVIVAVNSVYGWEW